MNKILCFPRRLARFLNPYYSLFVTIAFILLMCLSSCEKDITVDLPPVESRLVVEGHIEPGLPPYVMLTKSKGYFAPASIADFENSFVRGADVRMTVEGNEYPLNELCSDQIPDSLLPLVADYIGVSPEQLKSIHYCIYTTFDGAAWGTVGKTYRIDIRADGKHLWATTEIPEPVPLDSTWFEVEANRDSLGYAWAKLSDPPGETNYYRFFTKREGKDDNFRTSYVSVVEDKFINGKSFEFYMDRGFPPNSEAPEDTSIERGYFKKGDTIVVKWCSIDQAQFEFWRTLESAVLSNGNPFASPSTVRTNIQGGGLGVWGGYGTWLDTIVAK